MGCLIPDTGEVAVERELPIPNSPVVIISADLVERFLRYDVDQGDAKG